MRNCWNPGAQVWLAGGVLLLVGGPLLAAGAEYRIGVARVDVTPEGPIRLSGYGSRLTESTGVAQRLWAKALAISSASGEPGVLIAVDNCGVPASITEELAGKLKTRFGLPRERLVVCSSHTHTGPCLSGVLPALFSRPIPLEHQERIEKYTRQFADSLERVASEAISNRRPGRLSWAQGKVTFARNRRVVTEGKCTGMAANASGAVDHALPVLRVLDENGTRAVLVNYACHCTTLGGEDNQICGDWAGYAQEYVEREFPGATCLVTIGCGADANPEPRLRPGVVQEHGRTIAAEVRRLLDADTAPITAPLSCRLERIKLPFDTIPERAEWEKRAAGEGAVAYHAKLQLARLDRGESLKKDLPYSVQAWRFGDDLTMIFLGGEVVVDYALRLKKEFGSDRLWVTAYANDVPCYIASRRVLSEGGYEADVSMLYYDQPTRLATQVEDLIVTAAHRAASPADARPSATQRAN